MYGKVHQTIYKARKRWRLRRLNIIDEHTILYNNIILLGLMVIAKNARGPRCTVRRRTLRRVSSAMEARAVPPTCCDVTRTQHVHRGIPSS